MHIAIGLIIAFVLVALLSNRKTRACRWRADRSQDSEQGSYFRCMQCGAEMRTTRGRPPTECLRESRF